MAEREPNNLRALILVIVISVVAAALISGSYEISAERIRENERARLLEALHEVLDPATFDNDLLANRIFVTSPELLGSEDPVEVFLASLNGEPAAAIFAPTARNGYVGPIRLLVGVSVEGTVTGVRVTDHRETPGLGDRVEVGKSDWILGFDGRSLSAPPVPEWSMVSDGGQFDAMTSATVTSRAVVQAVRNTLLYFQQDGEVMFYQLNTSDVGGDTP